MINKVIAVFNFVKNAGKVDVTIVHTKNPETYRQSFPAIVSRKACLVAKRTTVCCQSQHAALPIAAQCVVHRTAVCFCAPFGKPQRTPFQCPYRGIFGEILYSRENNSYL